MKRLSHSQGKIRNDIETSNEADVFLNSLKDFKKFTAQKEKRKILTEEAKVDI